MRVKIYKEIWNINLPLTLDPLRGNMASYIFINNGNVIHNVVKTFISSDFSAIFKANNILSNNNVNTFFKL